MRINEYTDAQGNHVTEVYDSKGELVERRMVSAGGNVTNVATGNASVDIQAAVVDGRRVRR